MLLVPMLPTGKQAHGVKELTLGHRKRNQQRQPCNQAPEPAASSCPPGRAWIIRQRPQLYSLSLEVDRGGRGVGSVSRWSLKFRAGRGP